MEVTNPPTLTLVIGDHQYPLIWADCNLFEWWQADPTTVQLRKAIAAGVALPADLASIPLTARLWCDRPQHLRWDLPIRSIELLGAGAVAIRAEDTGVA